MMKNFKSLSASCWFMMVILQKYAILRTVVDFS